MARRLRIQYEGALYHVMNRGNFHHAVFQTAGWAKAFEAALGEAPGRHHWRQHVHAVMRNHYHLALETSESQIPIVGSPNISIWLWVHLKVFASI